jgi:hypothetical protein
VAADVIQQQQRPDGAHLRDRLAFELITKTLNLG